MECVNNPHSFLDLHDESIIQLKGCKLRKLQSG